MERHLHSVPAGTDLADPDEPESPAVEDAEETNIVDLASERRRRRQRYHPAAGPNWLDDLFDDDDDDDDWDPLGPVC